MKNFEAIDFEHVIDNQLFFHYFQPIFDIKDMEIVAYEGLLRSNHVQNPEILFDSAIHANRLFELDTSSISKAIQSLNEQIDDINSDTLFFLNVYPSTLALPEFINVLEEIFKTAIIPRERIVFEINEAEYIQNYVTLKSAVLNLQECGFKIALDDVGKGNSSLERIVELQTNYIKLDKYFSADLFGSIKKQRMLKLLLDYCLDSNVEVVLEGIETVNDLSIAKSLRVNLGQGYLLARPDLLTNHLKK